MVSLSFNMTYYVPKFNTVYAAILELIRNKNEISPWGNILTDQVKFVLAIYLTTTNLHNGFSIPHLHAVSQLANISQCNNCADLMCWNVFNCDAWWSSHCWSYWEFVEDLINVRDQCRVTFLPFKTLLITINPSPILIFLQYLPSSFSGWGILGY